MNHRFNEIGSKRNCCLSLAAIGMGLFLPFHAARADDRNSAGAQWQQWSLSIPTAVNPTLDPTGQNCMVGQSDSVWYLAGMFGGGSAVRNCSIPEGTTLFFPVINSVNVNAPNVCGQGPANVSVKDLRAASAAFINGASNLSVDLDGRGIHNWDRIQSPVFAVALPESNIFDPPCVGAGLGNVPAGVFSPAVDDGIYVKLGPLSVGTHRLHIHAENRSQGFVLDVTYNLVIVPVSSR